MDREHSEGFNARTVERLGGPEPISAKALARETGVATWFEPKLRSGLFVHEF